MKHPLFIYFLFLSLIGCLFLHYSTTLGIGLSPDSAVYIGAARNLWLGNGLQAPTFEGILAPMTHYPPLLSMILSSMGYLQCSPITAFRYLHIFLYLSNISLIGYGLFRYSQQNKALTAWGITFITFSVPLLMVYAMAWSEALFLFWLLWSLFFMTTYIEQVTVLKPPLSVKHKTTISSITSIPNKTTALFWLVAASVTTAAAFLTRYIGITVVGTLLLTVLLSNQRSWWDKFKAAFLAGIISCLPMLLWLLNNMQTGGQATNRSLSFHLPTFTHIKQLVGSITTWLFPILPDMASPTTRLILALPLLILLGIYVTILLCNTNNTALKSFFILPKLTNLSKYPFLTTLSIFLLSYWLFLLVAITLFDASTPLNLRILMPVYLIGILWFLFMGRSIYRTFATHWTTKNAAIIRQITTLVASIFLFLYIGTAFFWAKQAHQQGLGFHHQSWKKSSIIAYLQQLPPQTPIYTNGIRSIYLLTDRMPIRFPMLIEPTSGQKNVAYTSQLKHMQDRLTNEKGILVYFNKYPHLTYLPAEKTLVEQLSLHLIHSAIDGNVYEMGKNSR